MYDIYEIETGYDEDLDKPIVDFSVKWYDPSAEIEFVQDRKQGEIYPFSGWIGPARWIASYDHLDEAWREIASLMSAMLVIK